MAKKAFYEKHSDPTPADLKDFREKFGKSPGEAGVGMRRDDDGVYIHTHRARSKSYMFAHQIPQTVLDFIDSTG